MSAQPCGQRKRSAETKAAPQALAKGHYRTALGRRSQAGARSQVAASIVHEPEGPRWRFLGKQKLDARASFNCRSGRHAARIIRVLRDCRTEVVQPAEPASPILLRPLWRNNENRSRGDEGRARFAAVLDIRGASAAARPGRRGAERQMAGPAGRVSANATKRRAVMLRKATKAMRVIAGPAPSLERPLDPS